MILFPFPVYQLMPITQHHYPKLVKVIFLAFALLITAPAHSAPQIEWQAPAFEIDEPDGSLFKYPASLEGPTIILFWATWCPYCKALMPHLQSKLDWRTQRFANVLIWMMRRFLIWLRQLGSRT